MSYNGSGVYTLPGAQLVNGEIVSATENNSFRNDVATALNTAWTRDGQSPATGNIPMGNHKFTGVAVGSAATDSVNLGQAQSSAAQLIESISGTDTITGVLSPALSAYATGQTFRFVSAGANTGAATININSLGAKSIKKLGTTALAAGDIPSGAVVEIVYDGTNFQVVNLVAASVANATNATNATNIAGGAAGQVPVQSAVGTTTFMDSSFGFKNRIINGAMVIDQRNAGASVTPTNGQYITDRWFASLSQASKYSVQQSSTAPAGFTNSLKVTSLSAYTVGASEVFLLAQYIEGLNVADLGWGTANAQAVTLSFKVRSSLTGTFGGSIADSSQAYSYPFSYTLSAADTWTNISITIPGPTSGTWLTTNGIGLRVWFGLGAGATYSGAAGSWTGTGYYSATGATSVVGTNGATLYITGVQLEKGSTATSFDYRPYGTELALCQRYYEKSYPLGTVPGTASGNGDIDFTGATNGFSSIVFPVKMNVQKRAAPTVTGYNPVSGSSGTYNVSWNGASNQAQTSYADNASESLFRIYASGGSGWSTAYLQAHWVASAEL